MDLRRDYAIATARIKVCHRVGLFCIYHDHMAAIILFHAHACVCVCIPRVLFLAQMQIMPPLSQRLEEEKTALMERSEVVDDLRALRLTNVSCLHS